MDNLFIKIKHILENRGLLIQYSKMMQDSSGLFMQMTISMNSVAANTALHAAMGDLDKEGIRTSAEITKKDYMMSGYNAVVNLHCYPQETVSYAHSTRPGSVHYMRPGETITSVPNNTYGRSISITKEALLNDDMSAFASAWGGFFDPPPTIKFADNGALLLKIKEIMESHKLFPGTYWMQVDKFGVNINALVVAGTAQNFQGLVDTFEKNGIRATVDMTCNHDHSVTVNMHCVPGLIPFVAPEPVKSIWDEEEVNDVVI